MERCMNTNAFSVESDNLLYGGSQPILTDAITIKASESIKRGSIIAKVSTTHRYLILGDSLTEEETQANAIAIPDCITAQDIAVEDITGEEVVVAVYISGLFNGNSILSKREEELTEEELEELRKKGIFIKYAHKF